MDTVQHEKTNVVNNAFLHSTTLILRQGFFVVSFNSISLAEKKQYYEFWDATPCHSIDYTLPNLFGWQQYFSLQWAFTPTLCFIRQNKGEPLFWAPLGNWNTIDFAQEFSALPKPFTMIRVPEPLLTILQDQIPDQLSVTETRGQWEYLYARSDLENLPGKTFHKKKNHYNNFIRAYGEPDYRPVSDSLIEDVLGLEDEWCQWHECEDSPSLNAENAAINQVLSHWEHFRNLQGGALYIDDRIAAFSIGEQLDQQTLGVHFEKGLLSYVGIYQTINREYIRHIDPTIQTINRAQDLDEEGLRAAKMSYNPQEFLKKYSVTVSK